MKGTRNIWVTLLLASCFLVGAKVWDNISHDYTLAQEQLKKAPKEALVEADKALDKALKQHDAEAALAALIKGNTAQTLIDRDSLPSLIERTESIADKSTDPVEQSMIRLYSVNLYKQFFQGNYSIVRRADINDFSLPIESWSQNMFNERIDTLLVRALSPAEALQATPVSRYAKALQVGNDTIFRPTLYDFITAQAIDTYQDLDNTAYKNRILQRYAEAIQAHKDKALSAPVLMWELQRAKYLSRDIPYYHKGNNKEAFYHSIDTLKALLNRYQSLPYSVEIASLIVSKLQQTGSYDDAKQALDLCNRWIALYPQYNRIALLKNQRNTLTNKQLSSRIPNLLYPGKSQSIQVSYRNIQGYTLNIYRQPDTLSLYTQGLYSPKQGEWSRDNRVASITSTTANGELSLISRDESIELPPLDPGFYVAELLIEGDKPGDAINFAVSRVKTIVRNASPESVELLAVDAQSGKPFSQATVNLYTTPRRAKNTKLKAVFKPNKIGLSVIKLDSKEQASAQVIIPGDSFSPAIDISSPYVQQYNDEETAQTALFTDRSLYRPGQTLYFSGIHYINTLTTNRVLPNEKVTIELLDPSNNRISSVEQTTDPYGQFNGSFLIPQGVLLGNYRIRANQEHSSLAHFSVEEYKLPIFQVEFNPVTEGARFGKRLTLTGSAIGYTGVPQAGAKVAYTIERQSNPFLRFYAPPQPIEAGETSVDASGQFSITFTPQRDNETTPLNRQQAYNYIVRATITASTGETVEQSTSVAVGDSPYFISVTAPQMIDKYQSAGKIKSEVRTLNGETVKRERRLLFYSLYDNDQTEELDSLKLKMQVGEVTIPANGTALYPDFTQWESGPYRIVALTTDDNGRMIQGECNFILYSDKDKSPARYTPLWLPRAEWHAEAGETVKIPIGSSCQNAYLFYSIYSTDRLLETQVVKLNNSCKTLSIRFDNRFNGLATINLLIVKAGKMSTATATIRPQEPSRDLTITTSSFRDKLLPGSAEQWSFSVTGPDGRPVMARFMAEMFDASMQAIRWHNWNFSPAKPRTECKVSTYPMSSLAYRRSITINDYQPSLDYPRETTTTFIFSEWANARNSYPTRLYTREQQTIAESADNVETLVTAKGASTEEQGADDNTSPYRSGEVSTAFFYPTLTTDSLGQVSFSFTLPNKNAAWQFLALAYTQELFSGRYEAQTVSSKPIMVSPNLPRFVRQADEVSIATAVQNRTELSQEGELLFELFDPYTEATLASSRLPFLIEAGESQTLHYRFTAPAGRSVIGFRVKASTPQYSDGEQQIIPILPTRVFVTDSQPFFIPSHTDSTTVTLPDMTRKMQSGSVESYRMTLQYTNNPAWYAVQALPPLTEPTGNDAISLMANLFANSIAAQLATDNPRMVQAIETWEASGRANLTSPLTRDENLKQLLLSATPWVLQATNESEQMQQLATLLDKNRADRLARNALRKLRELQADNGGICWFSDMQPGFSLSLDLLEMFSRMEALGIPADEEAKTMQNQLVNYIDQATLNRWQREENRSTRQTLTYTDIAYLYVRSGYRDIPLTGKLLAIHQKMMEQLKAWSRFNDYEKAYAALALYRYGFTDEAQAIVASLRQYAVTTPNKGMFWPNSRSSYHYRNGAVQKECAIFHALAEIDPITAELDAMRQWLLTQKQTNQWASVPSTLDAISVLLTQGTDWLAPDQAQTTITWGGKPVAMNPDAPFVGVSEYTLNASEITPANAQAIITTHHAQPSWGALYWQYYDEVKNVKATSVKELDLHRQLFVRRPSNEGATYIPLNTTAIKPGDRIAVRLTITAGQDLQFLCLTDNRAACLEPAGQLSGYKYREGIGYYEEVGNTATRLYFEFLPKGSYVITYEVNVDRQGEYTQGLSTLQCLYAPQIIAHAPAQTIVVK